MNFLRKGDIKMSDKKTEADRLKEELFINHKHSAVEMNDESISRADGFCEEYKHFLTTSKTERKCVEYFKARAEKCGYVPFDSEKKYSVGDKIYLDNRGKSIIFAIIGKKPLKAGTRIAAAHIDSPRLDLKPNPLYEADELALFKTHYYGGIKKYQWTAIPLSLHGRVVKRDGTYVDVSIGENDGEPRFCVTDLLPHLAANQMKRTLSEGVKGEELNILIGSRPFGRDEGSELVKLNIMKIMNEKYGIVESDFLSAELEAVPAFPACDIGFDRSMIGSYGHDDRVCAYTAASAIFDTATPEYTSVVILADKEETGSDGNTGMQSACFRYFIDDLAKTEGTEGHTVLSNSKCLSADVNAAFDPTFADVIEKNNASYLNKGVVITKYTGARGKGDTSDASAEFMGWVRKLLNDAGVQWQTGELGKVDLGGGGTVAKYIANLNVDVIDVGVPVLSMHSPYEIVAKLDVYSAYRAFTEFFSSCAE